MTALPTPTEWWRSTGRERSDAGGPATVTVPDKTAPTAPVDLKAVSTSTSVALTWKAASDDGGCEEYASTETGCRSPRCRRGHELHRQGPGRWPAHRYYVKAFDTDNNEGPASNTVTRTFADTTAPSAPSGLARTLSGFTVRLTWRASTDNVGVQGYTVYRGGVAVGTSTTPAYTDTTAPLAKTSTYTVRARDARQRERGVEQRQCGRTGGQDGRPRRPACVRLLVRSRSR